MFTIERGTTQDIRITVRGVDLSDCEVFVTFKQDTLSLTKHDTLSIEYAEGKTQILLTLAQEETLKFKENREGEVQLRWLFGNGKAGKTKTKPFTVGKVLYDAVLKVN